MAIYKEKGFAERKKAADEAKKALFERVKAKMPDPNDPEFQARQAERKAATRMRDERDSMRQQMAARVAGTKRS